LQETYSLPDVENLWKTQWKGDLYFAQGSEHSRGVLILVKERLNFELNHLHMIRKAVISF